MQANSLANPDFVFSGQRLIIPVSVSDAAAAETQAATREAAVQARPEIQTVENPGDLARRCSSSTRAMTR
ncbi:MAG: hypothetical protein R3A10_18455 [Caldilineaceae bacterium]